MALPRDVGAHRRPARPDRARALLPGRRQPPAARPGDDRQAGGVPRRALRRSLRAWPRSGRVLGPDRRHGRSQALGRRGAAGARGGDAHHPGVLERGALDLLRGGALLREGPASGPAADAPDRDLARRRQAEGARPHRPARGRLGAVPLLGHAGPGARHAAPDRRGSRRPPGASRPRSAASSTSTGVIRDGAAGELVEGPPDHWVETLSGFATDLGFDTFVFWPTESPVEQLERFAREVAPALRV